MRKGLNELEGRKPGLEQRRGKGIEVHGAERRKSPTKRFLSFQVQCRLMRAISNPTVSVSE
jgi:hypothetical protein